MAGIVDDGLLDSKDDDERECDAVFECGGPTGTILDPNSTPMVTSCWGLNRPSHSRIVKDDLPQPESPIQTSFAI
jgi:hypothetical protein